MPRHIKSETLLLLLFLQPAPSLPLITVKITARCWCLRCLPQHQGRLSITKLYSGCQTPQVMWLSHQGLHGPESTATMGPRGWVSGQLPLSPSTACCTALRAQHAADPTSKMASTLVMNQHGGETISDSLSSPQSDSCEAYLAGKDHIRNTPPSKLHMANPSSNQGDWMLATTAGFLGGRNQNGL